MGPISKADVTTLFTNLVKAANENTEQGKKEFIRIMKSERDKFNQPMDITFANGNTINHSIARAISKCEKNGCGLCISKDASSVMQNYGEAPYIVFNYINDNDDVKSTYKKLFSNSYATTENYHKNKYTPLDFAKTCNPDFAEYVIKAKSLKESVRDAITGPIESVSNLANRVISSKRPASTKENKPEPVKDEDLTVDELKQKIDDLEKQTKITHTIVGPFELTTSMKKRIKPADDIDDIEKKNTEISEEQKRLQKILDKKTKKSALSMAKSVFGKKGGKTRKHKKTKKRRTYRRK
jgi:hypothetical protein